MLSQTCVLTQNHIMSQPKLSSAPVHATVPDASIPALFQFSLSPFISFLPHSSFALALALFDPSLVLLHPLHAFYPFFLPHPHYTPIYVCIPKGTITASPPGLLDSNRSTGTAANGGAVGAAGDGGAAAAGGGGDRKVCAAPRGHGPHVPPSSTTDMHAPSDPQAVWQLLQSYSHLILPPAAMLPAGSVGSSPGSPKRGTGCGVENGEVKYGRGEGGRGRGGGGGGGRK